MSSNKKVISSKRSRMTSEIIRRAISDEIIRERMFNGQVSVTRVLIGSDMRFARIFVSCIDDNAQEKVMLSLNENKGHFRNAISKQLATRYCPDIGFYYDEESDMFGGSVAMASDDLM
ncbi:30S ribosome-binding factor RbfA [Rickettsiales bacterium]|nr:30S ribosome-binding factor RbfA [Rickettsiales bacterium]